MKPAPFAYHAPHTLDEALTLLQEHGDEGKILAGGQSLVPAMNFRLAQPSVLIDINRLETLSFLNSDADESLRIGALTRHRTVERSDLAARVAPLLHATMPYIAHVQIRNRGTIGGSIAHADPAAELPAVMVALDARFKVQSVRGSRWIDAADFFLGLFATALDPDEMLVEIALPALPPRTGWSIQELARRHGDYAIVGVAATATLNDDGTCGDARLVYLSVGEGPTQAPEATASLIGRGPAPESIAEAARIAAQHIEPMGDIHASPAYRRHLIEVLGRRALTEAFARARQER